MLVPAVAPPSQRPAVPAASAPAPQPPLKVQRNFGGFAFSHTGSALKAEGITITDRSVPACARGGGDIARPACSVAAPGFTPETGAIAPDLSSGSTVCDANVKFVRGSRSLPLSTVKLVGDDGLLIVDAKIGGGYVSFATERPKLVVGIGQSDLPNDGLALTAAGARAMNRALHTHLATGTVLSRSFGGLFILSQANLASGSAVFDFSSSVGTVAPTGTATTTSAGLSLPLVPKVAFVALSGLLDTTLHYTGGFTFTHSGTVDTLTDISVDLRGNVASDRQDRIYAEVNGHEVELATALQNVPNTRTPPRAEVDDEAPLKLTAAAAKALGAGFKANANVGSLVVTSSVPPV